MFFKLTILFTLSLLIALFFTPVAKRLAKRWGAIDIPNKRKIHSDSTPRLGGIAVALSFFLTLAFLYFVFPELYTDVVSDSEHAFMSGSQGLLILISFLLVLALGSWDDVRPLSPGPKFAIQFIAASLICLAGFSVTLVTNPAGPGVLYLKFLSFPVTVIWIVGITNAFNLIDGLDGLASGVAAIALITIVGISLMHQQMGIAFVALILTGAVLGFLWFNFRPASIFLGDSGSLFLGFFLAVLSIQSYTKVSTTFATLIPVFALGLPILDTFLAMIRRLLSWFLPEKNISAGDINFKNIARSIFTPDKSHIHHQLINKGMSHKNTVLLLYFISFLFCTSAFLVAATDQIDTTILAVFFVLFIVKMGINKLSYREISLFHNGIFLSLYNYFVLNKRYFRNISDGLFVLLSYAGSYYILYPTDFEILVATQPVNVIGIALIILSVQLAAFWLSGLYKKTIRHMGIADVTKVLQSVALATLFTIFTQYLFFRNFISVSPLHWVVNFYFLLTLVLGLRISFHILKYLFYKSRNNQQRILIYGAGEQGVLALRQIQNIDPHKYTLVGFLDENPNMEGKRIHDYPVFGGHWKLERLVRSKKITRLIITDYNLHPKIIHKIHTVAHQYNLDVQLIRLQLQDLNLMMPDTNVQKENIRFVN